MNLRSGNILQNIVRFMSSKPLSNNEIKPIITNRNPRNLEKMRLARKPTGWFNEKDTVEFWHKLLLTENRSGVTAELMHNTEKVVVKASTSEWAISQFLYSNVDRMAYITLGRVFAERCLESGISCCYCSISAPEDTNVSHFLRTLEAEGFLLKEPEHFDIFKNYVRKPEKRPWTVLED